MAARSPDFTRPSRDTYSVELINSLIPDSVTNPVHALAVGFLSYLRLCDLYLSRTGFRTLEDVFGATGYEAAFYVADLQYHYLNTES